jgi:hypothetical protein
VHPRNCHDDFANVCCGALYSLANHLGAYADLIGKATAWDDEPTAAQTYQQQQAERRHRDLMARYGQPVSLNPLLPTPPAAAELPEHVADGLQRAKADALLRRSGT